MYKPLPKDIQMAGKHMKNVQYASFIREMQTKTTTIYYYILTWMTKIRKIDHIKCEQACEQLKLSCRTGGNVKWDSHLVQDSLVVVQKFNTQLS